MPVPLKKDLSLPKFLCADLCHGAALRQRRSRETRKQWCLPFFTLTVHKTTFTFHNKKKLIELVENLKTGISIAMIK
jgi:hypothetical protein